MGFQSKTYSLSDEVIEAIEKLRRKYGSPNKGLKAVLINQPATLDAVGPRVSKGKGKVSYEQPSTRPRSKGR